MLVALALGPASIFLLCSLGVGSPCVLWSLGWAKHWQMDTFPSSVVSPFLLMSWTQALMEHKQGLAEGSLIRPDLIWSPVRLGWMRGEGEPYCAPGMSHLCTPWTLSTLLVGMTIPR